MFVFIFPSSCVREQQAIKRNKTKTNNPAITKQTKVIPADPALAESKESVLVRAGQVWYPDSAFKTAQVRPGQVRPAAQTWTRPEQDRP